MKTQYGTEHVNLWNIRWLMRMQAFLLTLLVGCAVVGDEKQPSLDQRTSKTTSARDDLNQTKEARNAWNRSLQKRYEDSIFNKDGWVGFSNEGLILCVLRVERTGNGILVIKNPTSNETRTYVVRNFRIKGTDYSFDFYMGKSTSSDKAEGSICGFTLKLELRKADNSAWDNVKLVKVSEVCAVLQATGIKSFKLSEESPGPSLGNGQK
jgi:hypothetical protein